MKNTQVARLLTYVTEMVNKELLLQNEYLKAENRILRQHLPAACDSPMRNGPLWPKSEKESARRLLKEIATVAKPETILDWYRKLVARKFDGSKHRAYPG